MNHDELRESCELLQDIPDNTVSIEAMKLAKKTAKGCLSLLAERDKLKEEVEELQKDVKAWIAHVHRADDNEQRLKAQLKTTREALEPFALRADAIAKTSNDEYEIEGLQLLARHFRRVKAVYEDKDYDN